MNIYLLWNELTEESKYMAIEEDLNPGDGYICMSDFQEYIVVGATERNSTPDDAFYSRLANLMSKNSR